ncbi:MAG: hypothetical protein WB821_12340 [Burkholderiaceae bacterium]
MRIIFGLVGLLVVLAIVGSLAKKQLNTVSEIKVPPTAGVTVDPNASVKAQSQQIQQQIKQSVEQAVQQARPEGDGK